MLVPAAGIAAALSTAAGLLGPLAAAEPTTAMAYPQGATATRFTGLAFDACDAPPRVIMDAWRSSPYGAIGIYTSGFHRACKQQQFLTPDWVRHVSATGWKLIPIDVSWQAACADNGRLRPMSRNLGTAERQGRDAARGAVSSAQRLGILPGSAIYSDIESYDGSDSGCVQAVRSYVSGWTKALHAEGYLSGVYGNLSSAVRNLSASYNSTRFARPDAVWSAQWDKRPDVARWSGIPADHWGEHQRLKQYRGTFVQRFGGFDIPIDANLLDAPVATVAHRLTVSDTAAVRPAPTARARVTRTVRPGSTVHVVCQVATAAGVWDKLPDGSYLPDAAVADGTRKPLLPECTLPHQVAAGALNARQGPSTTTPVRGALRAGELAWVTCETPGSTLGRAGFWSRLDTGLWVSGALLARPDQFKRAPTTPVCGT